MLAWVNRLAVNLAVTLIVLAWCDAALEGFQIENAWAGVAGVVLFAAANAVVLPLLVRLALPLAVLCSAACR